jgi:uncharacterized SAM-binding protein YcdF (DUF218 family)
VKETSSSAASVRNAPAPARRKVWLFWTLIPLALLAGLYLYLACAVLRDAQLQELHRADAIIVFGAAEYDGRPSPVYRARLDHAYQLFLEDFAPVLITSGGSAADPNFSEGGVGHDYLMHRGVPESALIAETQASDTAESAQRVAVIMRANHMTSCIAVSDAYHVFRIRKMLEHERLRVYLAPRLDSRPKSVWQRGIAISKEVASYMVWRLGIRS